MRRLLLAKTYVSVCMALACLVAPASSVLAQPSPEGQLKHSLAKASQVKPSQFDSVELKAIENTLRLSGLGDAFSELTFAYSRAIKKQTDTYQLPPEQQALLETTLLNIDATDLLAQLRDYIAAQLTEQSIEPVLAPLSQNIVERFRRFERIAASPQQVEKMQDYIYWLENEEPLEEGRRKLLRDCFLASGGHRVAALLQSFAEVDTAVAYDVMDDTGVAVNDPEGVKLWRSELEKQYTQSYRGGADSYLAFAYQFIRDEQLQQYAALWQDRNLQWFLDVAFKGMRSILQERRVAIAAELYQNIKKD